MGTTIDEYNAVKEYHACVETIIDRLWTESVKYQMMQADYETRLKADLVAMLTEIQLEIEEKYPKCDLCEYFVDYDYDENDISEYRSVGSITDITDLIQQKINSLKEKS